MQIYRPENVEQLCDAVIEAADAGRQLEICGGGSKSAAGAPRNAHLLDMRGFSSVIDYDPAELILTVGAGTPLAEIEALVASEGQMLAFDPFDHGPCYGQPEGKATMGGIVAAGVAGSCRVTAGGARDHLLGFRAVSGRGEVLVGGAKVVKNVTGYDLPKLMAGSWGRVAALTELTIKVLPRPRVVATMMAEDLTDEVAMTLMARALGSHADVSAAAHLPAACNRGTAVTVLRVAGFAESVDARCSQLPEILRTVATVRRIDTVLANDLWGTVRHVTPLQGAVLWRVHLPPSRACQFLELLNAMGARSMIDWGGALIWVEFDGPAHALRSAASACEGQATLVRAPDAVWRTVPMHHPRAAALASLEARVRRAFDPHGVFETGRFLEEAHAN